TVLPPAVMFSPVLPGALAPLNSTIGGHATPGWQGAPMNACCVVPSITTGTLILGSAASGNAGAMVNGPGPGMLKLIVFGEPGGPTLAFDSIIAWRSDPAPLLFVFVTVNVNAVAGGVVVTLALLFTLFGSASNDVTVARLVCAPLKTSRSTSNDAEAPGASGVNSGPICWSKPAASQQ